MKAIAREFSELDGLITEVEHSLMDDTFVILDEEFDDSSECEFALEKAGYEVIWATNGYLIRENPLFIKISKE